MHLSPMAIYKDQYKIDSETSLIFIPNYAGPPKSKDTHVDQYLKSALL